MSTLRQKRKERGLTLHQVANNVGLTVGNLSRIERMKQAPRPRAAIRIYRFFNQEIPLEDILNVGPAPSSSTDQAA